MGLLFAGSCHRDSVIVARRGTWLWCSSTKRIHQVVAIVNQLDQLAKLKRYFIIDQAWMGTCIPKPFNSTEDQLDPTVTLCSEVTLSDHRPLVSQCGAVEEQLAIASFACLSDRLCVEVKEARGAPHLQCLVTLTAGDG